MACGGGGGTDCMGVRSRSRRRKRSITPRLSAPQTSCQIERAFRSLKTVDSHLRPMFHWTAPRVAPTSSCVCSPITSSITCAPGSPRSPDETDREAAAAVRTSIDAKPNAPTPLSAADDGPPTTACRCTHPEPPRRLATIADSARTARNEEYMLTLTPGQPRSRAAPLLLGMAPERTRKAARLRFHNRTINETGRLRAVF